MISPALSLISSFRKPYLRLGLFGLTAAAAVYFGFLHFSVPEAQRIVRHAGYYVILLTFALWLATMWRLMTLREAISRPAGPDWRSTLIGGGLIVVLAGVALSHETFRSKVLFDEYVLQSTAYNMHFFRDNSAMVRGYEIQGVFLSLDNYVDKRPAFFPFLLSAVHDVSGYRIDNVFVLNAGLFVVALGLIWWLGWRLNGSRGGLLAVALLGSLPLFAQNATGAGMELLNLCVLVFAIVTAAAWLHRPDEIRLSALVLSAVLLVQSRYESALYVVPAAMAILIGWWRVRRIVMSWPVIAAPLLLIPVALQQVVVSNTPIMWELHENQTARFSVDYLPNNLRGAWSFFASFGIVQANSLLLGALGALALVVIGWQLIRTRRWRTGFDPLQESILLFGAGMISVTALIMFYYWAAFDDPMASRFALPMYLLMVLAVVTVAARLDRRWPVSSAILAAVAIFTIGSSAPKQSYHFYSHMGNDELAWERRFVAGLPAASRLIITNKSTLPWLIEQTPSILLERSRAVADRLAEQLAQPDFSEILVTQCMRPSTKEGDYQIPPEDLLPDWFHLELLAERRFGTKLARISRLVSIDLPADFRPSSPLPVTTGEAGSASRLEK